MRRNGIKIMISLIGLIKPLVHIMIVAIVMGVLGFLCSIFIPIFGGYAILKSVGYSELFSIKTIFIIVIVLGVLRGFLHYIEQLSNHYIAFKLLALIRDKIFIALRKLSPAKLDGKEKGNLIALITSDIELLEVFYAHTISPIAIAFITSLIMVLFIGSFHILFGLIALVGYLSVGFIIPVLALKFGSSDGMKYREYFGKLNSYFLDSLWGIREVIQFGLGYKRLKEIERQTDNLGNLQKRLKNYEGITLGVTGSVIMVFGIIMLIVSLLMKQKGYVNYSAVIIPTIAMLSSFGPVIALSNLSNNLFLTLASGERVLNLLDEKPAVEEIYNARDIVFEGASCSNIYFDYGGEEILKDYNIDIEKNKIVGVSGKSGSGKSTLLKLLMRFWDVKKGSVEISDVNVKDINTECLRDVESYVTQETSIFHDTIENNVKIGNYDATRSEVIEACKKASLHDFITTLPDGYDTNVGELGETLSGGERQRIGIARSFLHNAPFILLDEPTSNLDSLNEAIILKSIKDNSKDRTVVLVSHRKSTINIADKVYHMKDDRLS